MRANSRVILASVVWGVLDLDEEATEVTAEPEPDFGFGGPTRLSEAVPDDDEGIDCDVWRSFGVHTT